MPRHPDVSNAVATMRGGVFSTLAHRIRAIEGETYPLHVGDTWMEPPEGARMEDLTVREYPGLHRYSEPHGHPVLFDALEQRLGVSRDRILVSAGATGGLSAIAGATLSPGDEVLVLAPFWPLIRGIVQSANGVPVQVPFYDQPGTVAERLDPYVGPRTVALYVNTPSNPTGRVLREEELVELARFARDHNLWVWSDEVYEDYVYHGTHRPMSAFAPERTFTARSFSKAYGMAGNRCGYVVGPEDPAVILQVRKVSTHCFYAAPTAAQIAASRALQVGDSWIALARESYRQAGEAAAAALGLPAPEGGTFLFLDVAEQLDERGLEGFLFDCIDRNLVLAPGWACGDAYSTFVRLCFTSAPPDVVARGVAILAELIGR